MASLLAGLAAPAAGAAAPTAASFFGGAAPAVSATTATGLAAPAVGVAMPAAAAAPTLMQSLGTLQAAPAFGNSVGVSYGQLANLARSQGNTRDFAPITGSISDAMANQRNQLQGPTMQGLPMQQSPDILERILSGLRNVGSM